MSHLRLPAIAHHTLHRPNHIINMLIRRRRLPRNPTLHPSPIQRHSRTIIPINLHSALTRPRSQLENIQVPPQPQPSLHRMSTSPIRIARPTLRQRNRKAARRIHNYAIIRRRRRDILHNMSPSNIIRRTATNQLPPVSQKTSEHTTSTSTQTHQAT